ncbi:MAG: hypothetical protein JST33_16020 [Actinobacteria bacterium]|nr:hypothetical protein [Actinomycetota bacterium]
MAAWVVNVFAHERAEHLGEALRLAEDLRAAQADVAALATARGEWITEATLETVR